MNFISLIQQSLQAEAQHAEIDGWLLTNFAHRDNLTNGLLQLSRETVSSRRWVYIIPSSGNPIKIVHAIETHILDSLPGEIIVYKGQAELLKFLSAFAGKKFAALYDSDISVISTIDAGFIQLAQSASISFTSAASLIQRYKGLLSASEITSHERSATLLHKTVEASWNFIKDHYHSQKQITEVAVQDFILEQFSTYGLFTDHPPIVAFGKNSGNPHYEVNRDNPVVAQKGDIIQLDIWAKEQFSAETGNNANRSIFADISWVGIYDTDVPAQYQSIFSDLAAARDIVYDTLSASFKAGKTVCGSELDHKVRSYLIDKGYGDVVKHRTGHGIDTDCHGSGVNLDSVEFPDHRLILEGSCFSIEPGLYFADFGLRTEINIYINKQAPIISGSLFGKSRIAALCPQQKILDMNF